MKSKWPNWQRWQRRLFGSASAILLAWLLVPAPLSGYWHTPVTDCLCDSKNLVRFEAGSSLEWATAHGISRKVTGSYVRSGYWYVWRHGEEVITIKPGWRYLRIRSKDGETWGWRELNRRTIREVTEVAR